MSSTNDIAVPSADLVISSMTHQASDNEYTVFYNTGE